MIHVFEALLNSLAPAAAVAAAVWLVLRLAPGINAATRYAVWWAVLAVVVLMPGAIELNRVISRPAATVKPQPRTAPRPIAAATVAVTSGPALPVRRGIDPGELPQAVAAAWALVSLVLLLRIGWSYFHLRRLKRRARPAARELQQQLDRWLHACRVRRKVRLLLSDRIGSPLAAGFLHPAILLPDGVVEQFGQPELDHVLLHELAHVARRDDWTNLATRIAGSLLALHPVAAWVVRRIDREREMACDDWVVAHTGQARPYAASLARLFELCAIRRRIVLASGMAESAGSLSARIEVLLRCGRQFTPRLSAARVAAMTCLLVGFAAAGVRMPRWVVFYQTPVRAARSLAAMPAGLAADPNTSFLAAVVASGYGDLSVDDIIALKEHGVSGAYLMKVSQAGWGKLQQREIIDLHDQGVGPEYLAEMRKVGLLNPTIADVIRLKQHGLRPEYVANIHACGMGPYSVNDVIDFAAHGLRPELFCALKDAGFQQTSPREIVDAGNQGLDPRHLREAAKYGNRLTLRQVMKMKLAGVI